MLCRAATTRCLLRVIRRKQCGKYLKITTSCIVVWEIATYDNISSAEAFFYHAFNVFDHAHIRNKARFMLFSLVKKPEALPPTSDALEQHIRRDHYQNMIWKQGNYSQPNLPSPTDSGWKYEDGRHIQILMSLEPIPQSRMELVSCQCKTGCQTLRWTCRISKIHCTQSCKSSNLANNIPCMNITGSDWLLVILRTISFHCSFHFSTSPLVEKFMLLEINVSLEMADISSCNLVSISYTIEDIVWKQYLVETVHFGAIYDLYFSCT